MGTPLKNGAKEPNFDYIKAALGDTLKDVYDGSQLIILRNTVLIGTTRNMVLPFLTDLCKKTQEEILVSMTDY